MLVLYSPLECFTVELTWLNFFNVSFMVAILSIVVVYWFPSYVVPNNFHLTLLASYRTILNLVYSYSFSSSLFPLIFTIFHLILGANLIGLIPFSFTPTAQLIFTLFLGISILIGVLFMGAFRHSTLLFGFFAPAGTPLVLLPLMIIIEILSYLSRTLSLGLRLAVNMITGHTLVKVFGSFIITSPSLLLTSLILSILTIFLALEVLIAYLQAYIFTFIICITLKDLS